jgi:hypothetical protein
MKTFQKLSLLTATLLLGSASALADIAEDVKSAARKLTDAASYSWTATTEIEGGQWTPAPVKGKAIKGGAAALLRNPLPAASVTRLVEKSKDLKAGEAGVIAGELSDDGAKEFALMGRGGRPGAQTPPEPKNAKGSVQFWLKEGQVQKIRLKVSATMTVNGEDRDMVRTTTWEIRDVGTTTVEVPAEAKKRLGS